MERALICRPSVFFPEQVLEHSDQDVQGLRAQSFGQGTSQMAGMGRMASRHSCLSTKSPGHRRTREHGLINATIRNLLDTGEPGNMG